MKSILLSLLLFAGCVDSIAQDTTVHPLRSEDYLKKSRSQTIGGFVLLAATVGAVFWAVTAPEDGLDFGAAVLPATVAIGTFVGSVFCFTAASRNKKRAASVSILNQQVLLPSGIVANYPSLKVRIRM